MCVYVHVYILTCKHAILNNDTNTGKESKPPLTRRVLDGCVYMYIYILSPKHAILNVDTNTGKESKPPLTSGSLHVCVCIYFHLLHMCIDLHTKTDTQKNLTQAQA